MTDLRARPSLAVVLTRSPRAARVPGGTAGAGGPAPSEPAGRDGRWAPTAHVVLVVAALLVWASSLRRIDLDAMNGYGLISVLPGEYLAATVVLCVGFAAGLWQRIPPRLMLVYPAAMVAVLHAVVPLVYADPRYSYIYKHVAVARYISEFGAIDRTVDIYHNWPGIFAAAAMLADVAGVDPVVFANWADPFFAACGALAVYLLAGSLTTDRRRVVVTVWLYVVASCGSQVYFAPQSLAYFLALVAVALVIRLLGPRAGHRRLPLHILAAPAVALSRRLLGRAPWLARLRLLPDRMPSLPGTVPVAVGPGPGTAPAAHAIAGVTLLAAAVVTTHQLTPFFLAMWLGALVVTGHLRVWWLPVLIGILMAFWIYLSYDFVSLHFTLFAFDPFNNVKGAQSAIPAPGSPEFRIVGQAARVVVLLVVGLAALSWWTAPRARRETFLWLPAAAPAVVLLIQSYGGEAIYRVVMFLLPWVCYLAARLLAEAPRRWPGLQRALVGLVSTLLAGLFLLNYYGLDQVNRLHPQEVRVSEWFETHTPPGALLTYLTGYWPTPATAAYADHLNVDGNWGGGVFSDTRFVGYAGRPLTSADIPGIVEIWRDLSRSGEVYVGLGPTQVAAVETYGYAPPGTIEHFVDALIADPRFRVVHQDGDAYLLRLVDPDGR